MFRKSRVRASALALAVFALLSAQSSPPRSDTPGTTGQVGVHIGRASGTPTLAALNADGFLAQVARAVQRAFRGRNHADVTPTSLAGELAETFEDVMLLPGEVKYEWRKNIITCALEKICIVDDLVVVGDPADRSDPVVVEIESIMVVR